MLTVLVVEDEKIIREGIRDCIDWQSLGLRIVGEADDGLSALREIKRLHPDILFTDVVMPGMDGIELLRTIRSDQLDVKVVFFSAHKNIEYIKTAMKYDAVDYLLKPFSNDELVSVMKKVVAERSNQQKKEKHIRELEKRLDSSVPVLKEKLLRDIILNEITDVAIMSREIQNLGLSLDPDAQYAALAISTDSSRGYHDGGLSFLSGKLANVLRLALAFKHYAHFLQLAEYEYACILQFGEVWTADHIELKERLLSVGHKSEGDILGCGRIAIGSVVNGLSNTHISYQQARKALEQATPEHGANVIPYIQGADHPVTRRIIRETIYTIETRYMENLTLHGIAEEVELSANYLCSLFKKSTGKTVKEYITQIRMEKAGVMLQQSHDKVYEIAAKVGYSDANYFGKLFKKTFGVSPFMYRNGAR